MKTTTTLALCVMACWLRWQDPPPAAQEPAPAPTPAAPASTDEGAKQVPEVPGRRPRHRLEGVYELRRRMVDGLPDPLPNRGYLAITGRHLFLNLASPGARADRPLVHAGVREWREVQGTIRTVVKLDYFSDADGRIRLAPDGQEEVRRIEPMQGGVRVVQGERSWLEFERIE